MVHGVSPLLIEILAGINQQDTPLLLSLRTPEITITLAERRKAMTWMQRLKRVFNIDIEKCELCGGHVKVVSCIEDPAVIEKILQHLAMKESLPLPRVHEARAPPDQAALFQL